MGELVEKWIADGMDYFSGVALYGQIGKNKLLKQSFTRNTISNQKKLEYELRKFLPVQAPVNRNQIVINDSPKIDIEKVIEYQVQQYESKQIELIKQLPTEMLPTLFKANLKFRENCILKLQMNDLPAEAEDTCLKIQLQIDANWKENALCWKQIDYYLEHKILPKEPKSGFEDLTPAELVKRQQYHFQNISKLKSRITENRKVLSKTDSVKVKSRLQRTIAKQENDLITKEAELQILNNLVNGKG